MPGRSQCGWRRCRSRCCRSRIALNLKSEKMGAKIRNAQIQKTPFMLVLGDREMEQGMVAVRERTKGDIGVMSMEEFTTMAGRLVESRALTNDSLESGV